MRRAGETRCPGPRGAEIMAATCEGKPIVDRCEGCAYEYAELPVAQVPERLRLLAVDVSGRLRSTPDAVLRRRPAPEVWSPLEYACHLRDVLAMQRERVLHAQQVDEPDFPPMDRESRVVDDRYNEQSPGVVAQALTRAAELLAETLGGLDESGWRRTGVYHWPERQPRSIEWVGRHTVHELLHHRGDIDSGIDAAAH